MANTEPRVLSIILGGGKGTRLYPLTKERSKPAVSFGGKYRIVDIPISNCINSGYKKIYLLTQFNSASLHLHISNSYNFYRFSGGFVEILAAEQFKATLTILFVENSMVRARENLGITLNQSQAPRVKRLPHKPFGLTRRERQLHTLGYLTRRLTRERQ